MKLGNNLTVRLHRTVRVKDGRVPAALPPSLGYADIHRVSDYKDKLPSTWEENGVFVALSRDEALWLSFSTKDPVALIVGAGGVNAITGQKLSTKLDAGTYLACPPQPWLDGWRAEDGAVFQFVAAEHHKGEGNTVAEQLIGAESVTGGIGLAVFEAKDPRSLLSVPVAGQGFSSDAYGEPEWPKKHSFGPEQATFGMSKGLGASLGIERSAAPLQEMGLGKGGRITQKIYPDPYGLEAWKEEPSATCALYIIGAEEFAELTGTVAPKPVTQEEYVGNWFHLDDVKTPTVGDKEAGPSPFTGLNSVFPGDTSNVAGSAVAKADIQDETVEKEVAGAATE